MLCQRHFKGVSEPFPSNEGRYLSVKTNKKKDMNIEQLELSVSEPFPSNEGRY